MRRHDFTVQCAGDGGRSSTVVDDRKVAIGACNIGRSAAGERQRFVGVKTGNVHRACAAVVEYEIADRSDNIGCPAAVAAASAFEACAVDQAGYVDGAGTVIVSRQIALFVGGVNGDGARSCQN